MVTGFEVFGAINGALGTLNLARQLAGSIHKFAKDWTESGNSLLELHDRFEIFVVRLENWSAKTWLIDRDFGDDVGKAYWGEAGWRSIAIQLAYIDRIAADFLFVFKRAADPAIIETLSPKYGAVLAKAEETRPGDLHDPTGLSSRRGDNVRKLRELGERLTKSLSAAQKAQIVVRGVPGLLDMLTALDTRFLHLERDANAFFETQYPTIARSTSQQERHLAAQGSMLLRNVKATKAASEALYRACGSLVNEAHLTDHRQGEGKSQPKLEMNLLATESRSQPLEVAGSLSMRYHLVLTTSDIGNEVEVLVEGPLDATHLQQAHMAEDFVKDFAEACRHIQRGRQCFFEATLDIHAQTANMFRLSSPLVPLTPSQTKSIHLSSLLKVIEDMNFSEASGQFPYTERVNLAFKVAECGLLLIGTSWLSSIDSGNVQRLSNISWKTKRRFIFEVKATKNEHLVNVEPHLFRIGKLLAEIAMCLPVKHVTTFAGPHGPELDLVIFVKMEGKREIRVLPAIEVEQQVRQAMGLSYSKAVAFCLQQSSDAQKENWGRLIEDGTWKGKEEAYTTLLANYHAFVYLPLQKHRNLVG